MNKILPAVLLILLSSQRASAMTIDAFLDTHIAPISDAVARFIFYPVNFFGASVPLVIFWILIAGIFFTLYFKGIAVWGFKHAIDNVISSDEHPHKGKGAGEVSSFAALATALSGTIGIGSIAGVAISISIGGPGAAFWIFAGAILGMSIKFVESSLSVKYRRFNLDGSVSGGPIHYMAHGLTRKKMRRLGEVLAAIFAFLCIGGAITGGNMIQINQSTQQIINITGGVNSFLYGYGWTFGLFIAILVGLIVIGGIKSIANVTTKLVPTMCFMYIAACLIVICHYYTEIPHALMDILVQAFHPHAVAGGFFGTLIIGLRRSVQSNEAGTGAAAIVYAAAKTHEHISQGFVSLLETFLTGVLCLLTSFAIVFSGMHLNYTSSISGIELTSSAFESVISWFPYILSVIVILFALSTLISWAYYGQKAWNYIVGEGKKRNIFFQFMYCAFIIVGSVMNLKSVIDITDAMMIAMSIPNIIVLYILAPDIKKDLDIYCKKHGLFCKKEK